MSKVFISNSEEETRNLGEKIGRIAKIGTLILLYGDLGAGKTAFTKGIGKGLGVDDMITSPTFTLMQVYNGNISLYHFDLYRISTPEELFDIGYEEYFYSEDGIAVIEWPERMGMLIPEKYLRVDIKNLRDNLREISFESIGVTSRLEDFI